MKNFDVLALPIELREALKKMQFNIPTEIQAQAIPLALTGRDILGTAQTGTGKTAAYGIPLIAHIMNCQHAAALVLTPTRELALQVFDVLKLFFGKKMHMHAALLIGGGSIEKQLKQLHHKPQLIVGTPGRINDHITRNSLKLNNVNFIVFDEADRMLDMGFAPQLQKIVKHVPCKRQMLMFSATLTANIIRLAQTYLQNAARIAVGSTTSPIEKIKQESIHIAENEKYSILLTHLSTESGSVIVFVKTKWGAERLAKKLYNNDHAVDAIHGDLRQKKREQVIQKFRNCTTRILVATDIAARGLDIPHVTCVINYDLPQNPEDYIHRIGRTGRAGAIGKAISLVNEKDSLMWKNICRMLQIRSGANTASPLCKKHNQRTRKKIRRH